MHACPSRLINQLPSRGEAQDKHTSHTSLASSSGVSEIVKSGYKCRYIVTGSYRGMLLRVNIKSIENESRRLLTHIIFSVEKNIITEYGRGCFRGLSITGTHGNKDMATDIALRQYASSLQQPKSHVNSQSDSLSKYCGSPHPHRDFEKFGMHGRRYPKFYMIPGKVVPSKGVVARERKQ